MTTAVSVVQLGVVVRAAGHIVETVTPLGDAVGCQSSVCVMAVIVGDACAVGRRCWEMVMLLGGAVGGSDAVGAVMLLVQ